jgi:hypothetical protein
VFKVAEVPLKSNNAIELEIPIKSQFIGVAIKQNIPVVSVLINEAQQLTERVKLVTVESGEPFGSVIIGEFPKYVGTFQHARRLPPNPADGADAEPHVDVRMLHVFVFGGVGDEASNTPGNSIILS